MCDCIRDTERQLKEMIKDNKKFKDKEIVKVAYPNAMLSPDENGTWKTNYYLEFMVDIKYETRGGNIKKKKEPLNVKFSYCPLCGKEV